MEFVSTDDVGGIITQGLAAVAAAISMFNAYKLRKVESTAKEVERAAKEIRDNLANATNLAVALEKGIAMGRSQRDVERELEAQVDRPYNPDATGEEGDTVNAR